MRHDRREPTVCAMGLIGSIFGGAVGFALGGPLGAVAGAALGHVLGQRGAAVRSMGNHEQAQAGFFISTFSMLAKMARADGRVTAEEIDLVTRFMREELALDPEAERYAVRIFRAAKDSPAAFEEFAGQFQEIFRHEPQMRAAMLDLLLRMAMADGQLDPTERAYLEHAARIFEVSTQAFESLVGQHTEDFEHFYRILGVEPDSTDMEVKRAYRRLVTEYHPDKVIAKGLPDEFLRFAEKKFQEIQSAYEAIREQRGFA